MTPNRNSRPFALSGLPPLDDPAYAWALGLAVAILLILTMRNGTEWDGDDALYIMNARNIVLGLPYAKTGYILNPDNVINPAAYPPGFPLLLAPIYWLFGVSFAKMKALCIVYFAAFVAVFARIGRGYVSPGLALATAVAVGFHPFYWDFKDALYSEFPFMFMCYASLLLIDDVQRAENPGLINLGGAVLALAFAYLIRPIGIVVFPAALLAALVRSRRTLWLTCVLSGCAAFVILLVQRMFPPDISTYVGYFHDFSLHGLRMALVRYRDVRGAIVGPTVVSHFPHLAALIEIALGLLCLVGFVARLFRNRISVFEFFFVGYVCFLVIYPVTLEASRYAMPIWPLLFLYGASGISTIMEICGKLSRRTFATAAAVTVLGCYGAQYAASAVMPAPHSIEAPQTLALFAAIGDQVPADAVVLTRKPTVIALLTGRRATTWGLNDDDSRLWSYIARVHVTYIVQERYRVVEVKQDQNAVVNGFIERNEPKLQLVFGNEWYNLYRVAAPP